MKLRRLFGRDDSDEPEDEAVADGVSERDAAPATDDASLPDGPTDGEAEGGAATDDDAADEDAVDGEAVHGDAEGDEDADGGDEGAGGPVEADETGDDDSDGAEEIVAGGEDTGHAGDTDEEEGGFREVEFELSEWGARERKLLDEILEGVRVRRVWQAGTLVVAAGDAEIVDDLIDEIDERMALDLPAGVDPVIYDVRDWPGGLEDRFVEALIDQRVPHMRGYQEITIGVDDEERVDTLVEEVTSAWEDEQVPDDEVDGPDAQAVLSELFVSSDRLLHDASDKTATVRFDDAAESAAGMGLPFGFAEGDWTAIKAAVDVLRGRLGDAEAQDEDIEEAATALRTLLRPLV